MPEFVIQPLELVNVGHDHGHGAAIAARAFDLLHDAQFKEPAVEDAGQAVEISQLFYPLDIVRVLNRVRANVGHGFQRLQFAFTECVHLGAVQRENAQRLAKGNQRDAHARG